MIFFFFFFFLGKAGEIFEYLSTREICSGLLLY